MPHLSSGLDSLIENGPMTKASKLFMRILLLSNVYYIMLSND